jgi:protein-tyrosine phosphatase
MTVAGSFGTFRGLVRLGLSWLQAPFVPVQRPPKVERLVFVCRGNVCRSAYADAIAARHGFPAASFGLRTAEGREAHGPVRDEAARRGIDLAAHRSVRVEDFVMAPGDLYLVMEVRQIADLRRIKRFRDASIDLLGRYGGRPHLHDPYGLSSAFTATSLSDIERSVSGLIAVVR